jgi:hypothetical protein
MPLWIYEISPLPLALSMVASLVLVSTIVLLLLRRYVLPRLHFHDGVNDAISGTVQAIGVFYGITVGLIAVGVWNTYSHAEDLVSQEAASIGALYRDASSFPEPVRTTLRTRLRDYTMAVIEVAWPAQRKGEIANKATFILDDFQSTLMSFEPVTEGQKARYAETLHAFNLLSERRRLRVDAVHNGLSPIMWGVILIGAAINIVVACFFYVEDVKLHLILQTLMAAFLGIVLFLIVINDRPFVGKVSIEPDSYRVVVDSLMNVTTQ